MYFHLFCVHFFCVFIIISYYQVGEVFSVCNGSQLLETKCQISPQKFCYWNVIVFFSVKTKQCHGREWVCDTLYHQLSGPHIYLQALLRYLAGMA